MSSAVANELGLKWFRADLHIHSVLSPCGDLEMAPDPVMKAAVAKGINLVAITDHNSFKNSMYYSQKAKEYGLHYLFGAEIQTAEEIHLIALFDKMCHEFAEQLYEALPNIKNDPDYFGDQVILTDGDQIAGFEEKALLNSVVWTLEECVEKINNFGGLCFPAHVDASSNSIISQLGFIPPQIGFKALGLTAKGNAKEWGTRLKRQGDFEFIRNSDAHYVKDVGAGFTEFYLREPSVAEIKLACQNKNERKIKMYHNP